jgi:hypothetical protein
MGAVGAADFARRLGGAAMKLSVVYQPSLPASTSPYRLRDEEGGELDWTNAFLDAQCLRQLSPRSLRIYAYDLLDFARWFELQHQPLAQITESTIVNYVRHQLEQDPKPRPQTVNHRLGTVRCCYRLYTRKRFPPTKCISSAAIQNAPRSATAGPAAPSPVACASKKIPRLLCRSPPNKSPSSGVVS